MSNGRPIMQDRISYTVTTPILIGLMRLAPASATGAVLILLMPECHQNVFFSSRIAVSALVFVVTLTPALAFPLEGRAVAFNVPATSGGSQLDSSAGLGEPLDVIISGLSSPSVLSTAGVEKYAQSLGLSTECLGIHIGGPQTANLGDGAGWTDEIAVLREDFGNPGDWDCLESLTGGNHLRFWRQTSTGAYFLAVSIEESHEENHTIAPDGYDKGRDSLVSSANIGGTTSFGGSAYTTTATYVNLLPVGSDEINHGIAINGRVAVLTVTAN